MFPSIANRGHSLLRLSTQVTSFSTRKKLTSVDFKILAKKGKKVTMVTAYDYPTGMHAENAEFDIILVGDSLGMVILGHETTQSVTMEDMIHHCKATRRGAPNTFIIGDMPFGSYEVNTDEAVKNAFRFLKEAGMAPLDVSGYGTLEERLAEGHDIPDEERALMDRALADNAVIVAQVTPFYEEADITPPGGTGAPAPRRR